jgi:tetratricopeptide (TPR) repeat protein
VDESCAGAAGAGTLNEVARPARTPQTPTGTRRRAAKTTLLVVSALAVAGLSIAAGFQIRRWTAAGRLPSLPDLSSQTAAVRDHLQERSAAALADPVSSGAVGALCLALHADLFYEQAARCYGVVESLNSSEWRWRYYRALLDGERARSEAVVEGMRQVVEIAPQFGPAWWRLGDAAFKEGRYDVAEDAWRRASQAPEPDRAALGSPPRSVDLPVSAYAGLGRARVALVQHNPDGARDILERLVLERPRFGSAFRLLAESYGLLGRAVDANRAAERAKRLPAYAPYADPLVDLLSGESRSSTFLLRQATEADLASDAIWSEFVTRRALEFDPDNPDVVAKLGRLLRRLGRSQEALPLLQRYSQMVPSDYQGVGQIGSCLSDLGRFEEAEPYLRRALASLDDGTSHYNLGAMLAATGRFDEAIAEYRRALERDPDDLDAHGNLAVVLVRTGKLAEASREFSWVLERDPDNAVVHTNYGVLLLRLGRESQAAAEFETALRLDPQLTQAAEGLRQIRR